MHTPWSARWPLLLVLATSQGGLAQKLQLRDDDARLLQLIDVGELLADAGLPDAAPAAHREHLAAIATFLRRTTTPALTATEDLAPMGTRHLAMLATPPQLAWVERTLAAAIAEPPVFFDVQVNVLEVDNTEFLQHLQPLLAAAGDPPTDQCRLAAAATTDLTKVLDRITTRAGALVTNPRLAVRALQPGLFTSGRQVAVVRDFAVHATATGVECDPIVSQVFDGVRANLMIGPAHHREVAVDLAVSLEHLAQPIVETQVPVERPGCGPFTVQVPRMLGGRLELTGTLPLGDSWLATAPMANGNHLVVTLRIDKID